MKNNKLIFSCLLTILLIFSVFIFGYRVLILAVINVIAAHLTELLFSRKKFNFEIYITSILYTLILPPSLPFQLSIFGITFGVFFGKLVYGGSGFNIFNPALVARIFLHVSFNKEMTTLWTRPLTNTLGGFATYIGQSTDSVSSATSLLTFRWTGEETALSKLFFGFTEGSIGETSAALILVIGLILIIKKIISKEIVFSILATYLLINTISFYIIKASVQNPLNAFLSGGLLFGAFLMATDPVTSPKSKWGQCTYGILIACITYALRTYGLFAGGIMFAILFANMMTPLINKFTSPLSIQEEV